MKSALLLFCGALVCVLSGVLVAWSVIYHGNDAGLSGLFWYCIPTAVFIFGFILLMNTYKD